MIQLRTGMAMYARCPCRLHPLAPHPSPTPSIRQSRLPRDLIRPPRVSHSSTQHYWRRLARVSAGRRVSLSLKLRLSYSSRRSRSRSMTLLVKTTHPTASSASRGRTSTGCWVGRGTFPTGSDCVTKLTRPVLPTTRHCLTVTREMPLQNPARMYSV